MVKDKLAQINNHRWHAKAIKKNGTERIYIKLDYLFDDPYVRSTRLIDNEENWATVEDLVEAMNSDLRSGDFVFAEAFPGASEEDKKFCSDREKRKRVFLPDEVTFMDGFNAWKKERFCKKSLKRQNDYKKSFSHILSFFKNKTFHEITEDVVHDFFSTRYLYGDPLNGLVSPKRMKSIRTPLWIFGNLPQEK